MRNLKPKPKINIPKQYPGRKDISLRKRKRESRQSEEGGSGSSSQLGSDRIVNAIGGKKYKNCLILDFGTATTFDIIKNGVYEGGVIAPGIKLSMTNLSSSTALLPMFNLKSSQKIYGKNIESILIIYNQIFKKKCALTMYMNIGNKLMVITPKIHVVKIRKAKSLLLQITTPIIGLSRVLQTIIRRFSSQDIIVVIVVMGERKCVIMTPITKNVC